MIIHEMINVQGRGTILVGVCEDGDILPQVGDKIAYVGKFWKITALEMSKTLMDPPSVKTHIGLVVRQWEGE